MSEFIGIKIGIFLSVSQEAVHNVKNAIPKRDIDVLIRIGDKKKEFTFNEIEKWDWDYDFRRI